MAQAFQTTRWSLLMQVHSTDEKESEQALDEICRIYWPSVCRFLQSQGREFNEAEELTQAFFAFAIGSGFFLKADPKRGKLRSFILRSLQYFLSGEHRKENAEKRGGEFDIISDSLVALPASETEATESFDHFWACNLLDQTLKRLRENYRSRDRERFFEVLSPLLSEFDRGESYARAATSLNTTEGAVRVAFNRLETQFRRTIRDEISRTLHPGDDIEEELRYLAKLLSSPPSTALK